MIKFSKFFGTRTQIEMLDIEVSKCNLRCKMCPNGGFSKLKNSKKGEMNLEFFKKIMDKFSREKVDVNNVWFGNWGEPLLNHKLPEMIRYCKERLKPKEIIIFTNLTCLRDPKELLESGMDEIKVSLSGMTQEIYSRNHRGGNVKNVLNNLLILNDYKKKLDKKVRITVRFHEYVYNKNGEMICKKFCEKNQILFEPIHPFVCCVEDGINFQKNKKKFSNFLRDFIDVESEEKRMRLLKQTGDCWFLNKTITIDIDGELYRCCGVYEKKNMIGTIFDVKIKNIPKIKSQVCAECIKTPLSWR